MLNDFLTAKQLRKVLNYSPETGIFTRKTTTSRKIKIGDVAGGLRSNGYIKIEVLGIRFFAHRLAWLYATGQWPTGEIDHRDGDRANNAFHNLRDSEHSQNCINRPAKGTRFHTGLGRWTAQIGVNLKSIYLGAFDSEQEAHAAYLNAVVKFHGAEWLTRKAA